jgi:cytochrome c biogenesis protein CcdA
LNHPRKLTVLLCLLTILSSPLYSDLNFDPPILTLPTETGADFEESVTVINDDSRALQIDLISSSEEWFVEPAELHIEAYGRGEFTVRGKVIHPADAVPVLMLSERDDVPYLYSILPSPTGPGSETGAGHERDSTDPIDKVIDPFMFFYSPGCEICEIFYSSDLPSLEDELDLVLQPDKLNIYESDNFELLESLALERGETVVDFPILIAGSRMFSGEEELREDFPRVLREDRDAFDPVEISDGLKEGSALPGLRWLPVFLAGLLDGINPCAFTSLIFLISYLRLLKKKGSEILKIGCSFTLAVFLTYFLIGLGAFRFIRMADSFSLVSSLIRYLLGGVLLILAVLTVIDYIRVKQGRASESILQLSTGTKKRIHSVVRTSSRSSLIYLSSFAAGFLISVYELGCTGQIYLPMLVYMVRQESWGALGPLLLYNIAFILPLILVFSLFYKGSDSQKIADFFQKRMGLIKLASAALFLSMGLFVLFF